MVNISVHLEVSSSKATLYTCTKLWTVAVLEFWFWELCDLDYWFAPITLQLASQIISRNRSLSWIVVKKELKAKTFQPFYSSTKSQSVVKQSFDSESMLC